MNQKEKELLEKIYQDCIQLQKRGDLTEYGFGRMDLCRILLEKD